MNTRRFRWVIIEILALCLIVVFGTFFYLHDLARVPPGVYVDETVTGYNGCAACFFRLWNLRNNCVLFAFKEFKNY